MALIRVFEIPPADGRFCFGGGKPALFNEVDWFRDDREPPPPGIEQPPPITTPEGRNRLVEFIKQKNYYKKRRPLLVLHPEVSFTIGYSAP